MSEGFSARLRRRHRLWWEMDWRRRDWPANLFHRVRQHYALSRRSDPDRSWKRGKHWQRTLSNKWNAREFAARLGCRVPALYWKGRRLKKLSFSALPEHFVLRAVMGHSRRGVYVFSRDFDLLQNRRFSESRLRAELRRHLLRWGGIPVLAEEFVRTEDGAYRLPVEYSFHTFAGEVGMISVKRRFGRNDRRTRHYTADWDPLPPERMSRGKPDSLRPPPPCLDEMLDTARKLGGAYGTYVRVDLFSTDRGCVFGEFSATPRKGNGYTAFADEYLGEFWRRNCDEMI